MSCASTVGIPYNFGFESGLGNWTQVNGDDFDWARRSGGTPSSNTGPSSATEGSYYLYIEASSPNYSNKTAIVESPCFDLTGASSATFSFKYHMWGSSSMGGLTLQASTNGTSWTNIWSLSGNQGNSWQSANIDLAGYLGANLKLRFSSTTGNTWQGDIAIDDLAVSTGSSSSESAMELTIVLDNYPEETSWEIKQGSSVLVSGGTYGSSPDGSTVIENFTLAKGCYDFVIYDAYGDGICCSYGNGSYQLTADGSTVASGGSFGASETTNFCLGGATARSQAGRVITTQPGEDAKGLLLFPNPARNSITIQSGKMSDIRYQIFDVAGKKWLSGQASGNLNTIDIS
ncbi:hypothetical protein E1176_09765, partial [Fulvivirga sp. RKSG066]|nr:hypothetical protein [Fulvivirga aurantia]